MRPDCVVVPPPALDDDLRLPQCVEDFTVEQLVAQTRVEALDVAVLPEAARRDVGGLGADRGDPFLHGWVNELRPVVGSDVAVHAAPNEEISQHVDDIDGLELATWIARHSWANSSITLSMRYFRPSWVRSSTKS